MSAPVTIWKRLGGPVLFVKSAGRDTAAGDEENWLRANVERQRRRDPAAFARAMGAGDPPTAAARERTNHMGWRNAAKIEAGGEYREGHQRYLKKQAQIERAIADEFLVAKAERAENEQIVDPLQGALSRNARGRRSRPAGGAGAPGGARREGGAA